MNPISSFSLRRRVAIGAAGLLAAAGVFAAVGATRPEHASGLALNVDSTPLSHQMEDSTSYAPVVKRVAPSVVKITVEIHNAAMDGQQFPGIDNPFFRQFFGNQMPHIEQGPETGLGSGVIISSDGYIVTNNHVVDHAKTVKVTLADGHEYTARVIGTDPQTDVAVIKVDAHNLPAITFGSSDKIQVGDRVLAIGNPFGIGETVTTGIVSAKERNAGLGLRYEDFIQTDAAINPGNSGGALVDAEGRLVGINTAILTHSGGFQGVGLAVPADLVSNVVDNLVAHGKVVRGYLGIDIQNLTPDLAQSFNVKIDSGALVTDVQPGSPAERAGIKSGDVVTRVNGESVDGASKLSLLVGETAPGTQVTLDVLRDGQSHEYQITTGHKPAERNGSDNGNQQIGSSNDTGVLNGVGVADIDSNARTQLDLPDRLHGALVTSVDPNSASARAGIKEGDVILELNHHPVSTAQDAINLTESRGTGRTLVKLWSHGATVFVVVDETQSGSDQ